MKSFSNKDKPFICKFTNPKIQGIKFYDKIKVWENLKRVTYRTTDSPTL